LYYQIALLGRRDLSLAPDEFAGFTMCLLRMLAFAPSETQGKPAAPPAAALKTPLTPTQPMAEPPAPTAKPPESLAEKLHAIQQAVAETRPAETATPTFDGNWRGLVGSLKLGGMARMLAQNCELAEFDGQRMRLVVPQNQKHLLDNTTQEKLRAVLKERFGKQLQIQIDIGGIDANTPARQIGQEKAALQAQAEDSIQNDRFVRDLMDSFGATIVPSSIKPIQ